MEAICTAGAVGNLTDFISLLSMYNCPATHITVANTITNIALANCVASLILLHQISPMHAGFAKENARPGVEFHGLAGFKEMRPPTGMPVPAGSPQSGMLGRPFDRRVT
jgi:hypothetical protein